ncbi:sperm-associated antigen 17-like isoform X2 [Physella acuta]|uniref:sperm-associated antigen 17-like isoform X2 n=1 Tax=Physella acuta TaxID=109671 RepID=UPI0027DD1E1E|nr:sperm-associated antigen 17-like isoform X2 [Physella acuta]
MAKAGKRGKSADVKGNFSSTGKDLGLSAVFEEPTWTPCVAWIVGKQTEDLKHVEALNTITMTGLRKLFSVVTKELLFLEIKEQASAKSKKGGKEVSSSNDISDLCKPYLDTNEPMPTALLAKLIKWKLLSIKANDLKRRELEAKAQKSKGNADKKKRESAMNKDRAKSPPKKGGKKTPEMQAAKEGSKLKKRGEEDEDSKFIDDEPDDGAHHYILVSGFHDPYLFQALEEININITAIIGISTQGHSINVPVELTPQETELKQEIANFWRDLLPLLQHLPDSSRLHDTAQQDYEVKSLMIPTDPNDAEQKVQYSTALFEDVAVMLYNLLEAKRLYGTFKENLKLINVPVYEPVDQGGHESPMSPSHAKPKQKSVDMRYYNDLMNCIPHESVSVPLIMYCMLEQITATEEGKTPPSEIPPPVRPDGMSFGLSSYLTGIASKLGLSEQEHQVLSRELDLTTPFPLSPSPPVLINYNDSISIRTQHLKPHYGFDPLAVEQMMLKLLPFSKLHSIQEHSAVDLKQRAVRLQELLHYCTENGLSKSEVDRAFKQFVFESMDLATTDFNGFILEKEKEGLHHKPIPWDDPDGFFKSLLPPTEKEDEFQSLDERISEEDNQDKDLRKEESTMKWNPESLKSIHDTKVLSPFGGTGRGLCVPPESERSIRESMESKKGILVSSLHRIGSIGSANSRKSATNSVHFDVPDEAEEDDAQSKPMTDQMKKILDDALAKMVHSQQRNLDTWCFAEHFQPEVFQQVLHEASYLLPLREFYHHKRDNNIMLVLHNPYNQELRNHVDWHIELHSNMGFRNYLEFTAESIVDWLKEKDAEYQAKLLSKEVASINKEEEDKAKEAEKAEKGKKAKSPSRSSSKTRRDISSERQAEENPYVRQGSLKAQQAELQRLAAEEEEREKAKLKKKEASATQKKGKEEKEKVEREKSKSPRSSQSRSTADRDSFNLKQEPADEEKEEEKFWPFYGYNTGNQLIHVSGITTTMFPSDGGQIKTERTEFALGTTSVRSVVLKDGHIFTVHILNPCESTEHHEESTKDIPEDDESSVNTRTASAPQSRPLSAENTLPTDRSDTDQASKVVESAHTQEKVQEHECKSKAVSQFGSVTAVLADGMTLAFSKFGPTGESDIKPHIPTAIPPQVSKSSVPSNNATVPSPKGKKESKVKTQPNSVISDQEKTVQTQLEELSIEEQKKEEEEEVVKQPFQELFITTPDGLHVTYFLQSSVGVKPSHSNEHLLAIKQCYPYKTKGIHECESARHKYIDSEISRVITSDGSVIKNMVDGSVEVLSADGTVSKFTGQWSKDPSSRPASATTSLKTIDTDSVPKRVYPSERIIKNTKSTEDDQVRLHSVAPNWIVTYPNGERLQMFKFSGNSKELPAVPISLASDPDTQQTMAIRDDHVITVSFPDGTTIVEHEDGTRITVYYRETPVAVEEAEHEDEESVTQICTATFKFVKVECPTFATVEFNGETSENLTVFGNGTSINVFPDGYYILHHNKGGRLEIDTESTMVYYPAKFELTHYNMPDRDIHYLIRHNADVIVETVDPDGNVFNVRSNGDFNVLPVNAGEELSDNSDIQILKLKEKKVHTYNHHAPRFFIIHADGSGTELLRYKDVAEYLVLAEKNPATAILKEPLTDHPGVTGITVLKPYLIGLSEKWFKNYDQESIIPSGIRCRDLKTLPSKEVKKPGPKFGTNVGKGLSIGTYSKSPARIPILKCPNRLEIRQLVQYKPVTETLRNTLKGSVLSYAEALLARMSTENLLNIDDPRSAEEIAMSQSMKLLAERHKTELPECDPEHVKMMYENAVAPHVPSPPPTPHSKRSKADWERDKRELQEEKEIKAKIRSRSIEPYFDSEIGKAFLYTQVNDAGEMIQQFEDDKLETDDNIYGNMDGKIESFLPSPIRESVSPSPAGSESEMSTNNNRKPHDTPLSFGGGKSESPSDGLQVNVQTPANTPLEQSLRPQNPTPAQAAKASTGYRSAESLLVKPGHLKSSYKWSESDFPAISEHSSQEDDQETKSPVDVNLLGQPRVEPVILPKALKGGRPGAQPNIRYQHVEEPVRRQVKTSLTTGATPKGQQILKDMRGLICQPEKINFGILKEGCTYAYTLFLKNTGVDACRFKVTQPPPATGLRVFFKPGAVAAGMSASLSLELYAIANGVEGESGVGCLDHVLEITTETHILQVPVAATILTANEYDLQHLGRTNERTAYARLISTKPPALTGIIRPRKEQNISVA